MAAVSGVATAPLLPDRIRTASRRTEPSALIAQSHTHLDSGFADLDFVLGHAGPSNHASASAGARKGKRRRTLQEEIDHWEREEAAASRELESTSSTLPTLLQETHTQLQNFLKSAQDLSLKRYTVVDQLSGLITELNAPLDPDNPAAIDTQGTLLKRMKAMQDELGRLEAGLAWANIVEQVVKLSDLTTAPASHQPSPLAAIPHYRKLHATVDTLRHRLPPGMSLLRVITQIRDETWKALRDALAKNLQDACEAIKWPSRLDYPSTPLAARRLFERAFNDMLFLQIEDEDMHGSAASRPDQALLALQAIVEPISLRFKYHFQGSKSTNRVDKPEWAFTNILDQIFEHSAFLRTVLQPLAGQSGFPDIDIRSEFTLALFPTLLDLLRSRIPHLLDRPALLAHTIYQTVLFDDAVRDGGFDITRTSASNGEADQQWEGLAGVILKEEGWYEQWLAGEKKFVDAQLHEIISSQDAWTISDEAVDEDEREADGRKPTISARQVKALVEQVTDRYSPLPALEHRYPFLVQIQLPTLQTYHQRINGSLDAFESLSSAFARHIPGALANTRSGVHFDQTKLTSGEAGLVRLIKANLSAGWILQALRSWTDETFFVEMADELRETSAIAHDDPLLPAGLQHHHREDEAVSVFDIMLERYEALVSRSEDMIVRLVTNEVESELREHLKRRWDQTRDSPSPPSSSLLAALATYTSHLRLILADLPPVLVSRLYRRIVSHLSNHITQRAISSGWSKFTLTGAKEFHDEMTDFKVSSTDILASSPSDLVKRGAETPWRSIMDKIAILCLPSESELSEAEANEGKATFSQGMAAAWSDGAESLQAFLVRAGVKMDRADLQAVLRRRNECWR